MNTLIAIVFVLTIAANAMATNNVQSYFVKHGSALSYQNPDVYSAPPQVPTSYRYDARFNPLKYGYAPPAPVAPVAPVPVYSSHPEYYLPQPVAMYISAIPPPDPVHAPIPLPAPAPAPSTYIPPHILAQLQAHARQFIGRHYPQPYRH